MGERKKADDERALGLADSPDCVSIPFDLLPADIKAQRGESAAPAKLFKSVKSDVKVAGDQRRITFYAAAFGNIDSVGDVIEPGAFLNSIEREGGKGLIKFFYNHALLLGVVESIEETSKGLLVTAIVDDDPSLNRYIAGAKSGSIAHGSIGYDIVKSRMVMRDGVRVREILEIRLWEVSIVVWPANQEATVEAVKTARAADEQKGLYDFAALIEAQARINYELRRIENITAAEWAELSGDEREQAQQLLDAITDGQKSLGAGLKLHKSAPADADADVVDPAITAALGRRLATLKKAMEADK